MVVAVNVRLLLKDQLEGIGRFTFELLSRITTANKEHTFIFLFDRDHDPSFVFSENVIPVKLFPPSRHPFLWYWYFQFAIPKALREYKADVFLSTDGWISLRTPVKTVQVLHDLHYERYPQYLPLLTRLYYRYFFPKFIRRADKVITVSHFSKKEICERYGVDENKNKISVVSNSSRENYLPLPRENKLKIRERYTKGKPYFLFIGPIHPRKNLENLVAAFKIFKESDTREVKLVITGRRMWKDFGSTDPEYFKGEDDIVFTGFLSEGELQKVTGAALSLLYVSFYEGFGLPILEAMRSDVPVITSNTSAMPEVAGEAAILIDPFSPQSISDAMRSIAENSELRQDLINKGRENVKRYSWERAANDLWKEVEALGNNS